MSDENDRRERHDAERREDGEHGQSVIDHLLRLQSDINSVKEYTRDQIQSLEKRLTRTRIPDTEEALINILGVKREQLPEYQAMAQEDLKQRKRRRAVRSFGRGLFKEGAMRGIKYVLYGASGAIATSLAAHYFPTWLISWAIK